MVGRIHCSRLVWVDNHANEDFRVWDHIYASLMVLRAEHSHLVKFENLVSLGECAILNDEAIPPVRVRLGSFHWEIVGSLNLYYYLVVLLLLLNDLDAEVPVLVQIWVDLYLAILGVALIDLSVVPSHCFVEFSRKYIVLFLKLDGAVIGVNGNGETWSHVEIARHLDWNQILSNW